MSHSWETKENGTRTKHMQGKARNRLSLANKREFCYLLSSDFFYQQQSFFPCLLEVIVHNSLERMLLKGV